MPSPQTALTIFCHCRTSSLIIILCNALMYYITLFCITLLFALRHWSEMGCLHCTTLHCSIMTAIQRLPSIWLAYHLERGRGEGVVLCTDQIFYEKTIFYTHYLPISWQTNRLHVNAKVASIS